ERTRPQRGAIKDGAMKWFGAEVGRRLADGLWIIPHGVLRFRQGRRRPPGDFHSSRHDLQAAVLEPVAVQLLVLLFKARRKIKIARRADRANRQRSVLALIA